MIRPLPAYLLLAILTACSGSPEPIKRPLPPRDATETSTKKAAPVFAERSGKASPALIIPKGTLRYQGKNLALVQSLKDAQNTTRGKLYVELLNDSTFKRLYILDGTALKYFAGDHYFTNGTDTIPIDEKVSGFRFLKRKGKSVVIGGVNSKGKFCTDDWTIQYIESEKGFNNPFLY